MTEREPPPFSREARRRRRTPGFAPLARGAAAALARDSIDPFSEAMARTLSSVDEALFVARVHGVSGFLADLLPKEPCGLPAALADALVKERERVMARNVRLQEDLVRLGARAARRGLPFVPLKGSFLIPERYRDPGKRTAADIDLLAPGDSFAGWKEILLEEGYVLAAEPSRHQVWVRPGARVPDGFGEHPDHPRPVDLHLRLRERILGQTIDFTAPYLDDVRAGTVVGVAALVPGPRALALHLVAHVAGSALGRGARLVQLADFRHLSEGTDVAAALAAALGEAAWAVVALVERSVPGSVPGLLRDLEAHAPSGERRWRWLERPGLMTGEREEEVLVLEEIRLCDSFGRAMRRLVEAVPGRDYLKERYSARGVAGTLGAAGRFLWERFQ